MIAQPKQRSRAVCKKILRAVHKLKKISSSLNWLMLLNNCNGFNHFAPKFALWIDLMWTISSLSPSRQISTAYLLAKMPQACKMSSSDRIKYSQRKMNVW